ncbi:hypothetical protein HT031_001005 [Scenedesmus sp. PABB004]|nr:hypothetical protein HT031_001005 [Scenedesmus sp. PABB004]
MALRPPLPAATLLALLLVVNTEMRGALAGRGLRSTGAAAAAERSPLGDALARSLGADEPGGGRLARAHLEVAEGPAAVVDNALAGEFEGAADETHERLHAVSRSHVGDAQPPPSTPL